MNSCVSSTSGKGIKEKKLQLVWIDFTKFTHKIDSQMEKNNFAKKKKKKKRKRTINLCRLELSKDGVVSFTTISVAQLKDQQFLINEF